MQQSRAYQNHPVWMVIGWSLAMGVASTIQTGWCWEALEISAGSSRSMLIQNPGPWLPKFMGLRVRHPIPIQAEQHSSLHMFHSLQAVKTSHPLHLLHMERAIRGIPHLHFVVRRATRFLVNSNGTTHGIVPKPRKKHLGI